MRTKTGRWDIIENGWGFCYLGPLIAVDLFPDHHLFLPFVSPSEQKTCQQWPALWLIIHSIGMGPISGRTARWWIKQKAGRPISKSLPAASGKGPSDGKVCILVFITAVTRGKEAWVVVHFAPLLITTTTYSWSFASGDLFVWRPWGARENLWLFACAYFRVFF